MINNDVDVVVSVGSMICNVVLVASSVKAMLRQYGRQTPTPLVACSVMGDLHWLIDDIIVASVVCIVFVVL